MESEEVNQEMFDNELDFEEEAKDEKDAQEDEVDEEPSSDVEAEQNQSEPEEVKDEGLEEEEEEDDEEAEAIRDKDKSEEVIEGDTEKVSSKSGSGSDGEISDSDEDEKPKSKTEIKVSDDREEGECSDGDDHVEMPSNRPRIPCRFYNRGFCSWGMNCKFIHAGFNDKGNYRMFEPMKHPAAYNNENMHPMRMMRPPPPVAVRPEPVEAKQETAWERGLRHAKEMMKQAQQRKETDIDFEDKKMNLSLGEDDILKEDVLYTRPASPLFSRSDGEEEENYPVHRVNYNAQMDRPPVQRRMPFQGQGARNFNGRGGGGGPHYRNDYNNHGYKGRGRGGDNYYEERKRSAPGPGRGDEWSDPWMRKRSPTRKRRVSYSSGSSYSSSSRSRSRSYSSSSRSSRSSYSSYSSRSRSKGRGRSRSRSRSRTRLSPIARKEELYGKGVMNRPSSASVKLPVRPPVKEQAVKPPVVAQAPKEEPVKQEPKKLLDYNPSFQNPPAPERAEIKPANQSVDNVKESKKLTISPFGIQQTAPKTLPVNMLKKAKMAQKAAKKAKKAEKKKKKNESESDSDSSSSSSASSSSSSSSSSDSEEEASKISKAKRKIVIDGREALANIVKISAMDALRLSGQKQQIKLKLKPSDSSAPSNEAVAAHTAVQLAFDPAIVSRKRSTESIEDDAPKAKKPSSSRREELLSQLKAIEDAIKKKRSKLQ